MRCSIPIGKRGPVKGTKTVEYCAQHAPDGMVDVKKRRKYRTEGCGKEPSYGVAGTKFAEYFVQHAQDGMVDVKSRKCRTEGCDMWPSYGVKGKTTAEYCAQHAPDGTVDVKRKKCRTKSCGKRPSYGVAGTKTAEYCSQHAPNGMIDASSKKCRIGGCGKGPSFGVANTRTVEYCAQHARLKCGVEGYSVEEGDPHHSGKETIGNIFSNGAKHQTVHPPATTSPPSESSQGSRKRVRYPEIISTTSMRPIARVSAGGAESMPDIDGQKISRQTRCFCKGGGAALLVARYTKRDLNIYLLDISFYILAPVFRCL